MMTWQGILIRGGAYLTGDLTGRGGHAHYRVLPERPADLLEQPVPMPVFLVDGARYETGVMVIDGTGRNVAWLVKEDPLDAVWCYRAEQTDNGAATHGRRTWTGGPTRQLAELIALQTREHYVYTGRMTVIVWPARRIEHIHAAPPSDAERFDFGSMGPTTH